MLTSSITAPMGWRMHVVGEPNPRSVQNWMMQASGAEMMRAAVVKMVLAGLTLCATAHDAIMIEAPLDRLADDVALAREIMERVSLSFTRGLLVRTDVRLLRPGERYLEPSLLAPLNRMTGQAVSFLGENDRGIIHFIYAFEAGGEIHHVADHRVGASVRTTNRTNNRLAGSDAHTHDQFGVSRRKPVISGSLLLTSATAWICASAALQPSSACSSPVEKGAHRNAITESPMYLSMMPL
jgi:hypothetical protein